jgi:hypothetical protein
MRRLGAASVRSLRLVIRRANHALLKYIRERAMAIRIYNRYWPVLYYEIKECFIIL